MAVLDTTIVNVALDTLSRELHAPLSTIQWVSTGYLLSLAAVIPLSGWITERFGSKRTWIASIALFAGGSALCALATSAGGADLLPRPAGLRRRHAHAGRVHAGRAERRAAAHRSGARAGRRADPARADLRAHHRRPDRRQRGLAVDLRRQRAHRRRGDRRRRPAAPRRRGPRRRRRSRLGGRRRCCAQGWRASSSASRRPRATAGSAIRSPSRRSSPGSSSSGCSSGTACACRGR